MKKKEEPVFLGTIHIQVGPKGFFAWIWDLLKFALISIACMVLFYLFLAVAIGMLSIYIEHHP